MDRYIECYVIYCTDDKTYLSYTNFWSDDIMHAIKYKNINRAKEAKSHYDKTVKIMKLSIAINGVILSQE